MTASVTRHAYGPDPSQFGELSLPSSSRSAGTVVLIHGGFWRARYDLSLARPLAADLARRGHVVWNLEYRRVGNGGGWPATFDDVAAGIDALVTLDVDISRVVAVGHSAGGHLAVWAAGRSDPAVGLHAVVSQAGVLDLVRCAVDGVGGTAAPNLMGGPPSELPDRYRQADPLTAVPVPSRVLCLHSRRDDEVPFQQSVTYVDAAIARGGDARLHETNGDHYTLIDPSSREWAVVVEALPDLLT